MAHAVTLAIMTAAISIQGLEKRYGDLRAVDGLDLEIERGEVFALLGPNGAGKSTTVEILEGFRKRDGGTVSVLGQDPQHPNRDWRSDLGVMLQSTSERGHLTARESLLHTSRLYSDPRDVDETLAAVGLTDKAKSKPQTLSGGQRRRLDVALAIIGKPKLVFLDEPTTGFDPKARRQFWSLLESLREGGTTIVLTTHYLDEAEYLADRIGIIAAGKLIALDTPAGLRSRASQAVVTWTVDGQRFTESTETPTALVASLSQRFGGEVPGLTVTAPSLEDVYLDLIGEQDGSGEAAAHEAVEAQA